MTTPYLLIKRVGDQVRTQGLASCRLGHQIPRPNGQVPDGFFAEWSWDGRKFVLRNDRYGHYPVYYYAGKNEFAVSTSIPKLLELGAPADLDDAALSVFLRWSSFVGEDTPFERIRAAPPRCSIEWEADQLRVSGGWPIARENRIGRDDAIEGYISLFRKSILRRRPPAAGFVVPLSGGRDSRHILLELCASGYRPKFCVTALHFPPASTEDRDAARQLAEALGLRHLVLDQPRSRLSAEARKNVVTNFCSEEHAWYLPIAEYLRGKASAAYDGIGGDVLSAGHFLERPLLELFEAGRLGDLASAPLSSSGAFQERALAGILPRELYQRLDRGLAVRRLTDELERHAGAPSPVASFMLANRTRRNVALSPFRILADFGQVETVHCPYLDHDVFDFLASLPSGMFLDHTFHTDTIRRAYPAYAGLPFAKKSQRALVEWGPSARFALEIMRYAWSNQPLRFVRNSFLAPRLLRCLADRAYSPSVQWLGVRAIYLIQLQQLLNHGAVGGEWDQPGENGRRTTSDNLPS